MYVFAVCARQVLFCTYVYNVTIKCMFHSLLFYLDAIPTDSMVRIAPSIQDRKGWLWNKNDFDKTNWMVDVDFSITGKHTFGADGMVSRWAG